MEVKSNNIPADLNRGRPGGNYRLIIPYWLLLFSVGFGQYIIAPLIPDIEVRLGASYSETILLISIYGYVTAILSLLSGWVTHLFSVRSVFILGGIFSVVGLWGRFFSATYFPFLIFDIIAAVALPMLIGPMGAVSESMFKNKSHTIVGVSTGFFFLGLAAGALLGPHLITSSSIFYANIAPAVVSVLSLLLFLTVYRKYPNYYARKSVRGSFNPGMIKNWYVAFASAGIAVMFGTSIATMLLHFNVVDAISNAGIIAGVAYLGSGAGSMSLPPFFERIGRIRLGMVTVAASALVTGTVLVLSLTYSPNVILLAAMYFLFGAFANSLFSMGLASVIKYVRDPGQAGLATSMYSTFEFLGVGLLPLFIGPALLSTPNLAVGVTISIIAAAFILSFFMRTRKMAQAGSGDSAEAVTS